MHKQLTTKPQVSYFRSIVRYTVLKILNPFSAKEMRIRATSRNVALTYQRMRSDGLSQYVTLRNSYNRRGQR